MKMELEIHGPARVRITGENLSVETLEPVPHQQRLDEAVEQERQRSIRLGSRLVDSNLPATANETMGGLPVAAASGTAEETGRTAIYARTDSHGTPHGSGVTGGERAATNSETHQRPSNNDKPCSKVVPQDNPSTAGTGSELLAGREGHHEGEAAPADLPTNSDDGTVEVEAIESSKPFHILRPHCRNPESCGGYGQKHCHSCEILMNGAAA